MAVMRRKSKKRNNFELSETSGNLDNIYDLTQKHGLSSIPFDIEEFIRHLGIRIRREAMDDDISGFMKQDRDGWVIGVNNLHHPRRQRFTLAHELAHYLLHRDESDEFVDKVLFRSLNTHDRVEKEANEFAAQILIPEKEFRNFINEQSKKIEDIAEHFNVSALAIRMRARNLGFSGHGL